MHLRHCGAQPTEDQNEDAWPVKVIVTNVCRARLYLLYFEYIADDIV